MIKNIDLILDTETAKVYLEKNALWWFECAPFTIAEFDQMVKEKKWLLIEEK